MKLPENSCNYAFLNLKKTPFLIQEGHFCSFAEKGRGLDSQDPPSCVPGLEASC